MKIRNSVIWIGALFAVLSFQPAATPALAGMDAASVDKCSACHEDTVKTFGTHGHSRIFKGKEGLLSCESCHGNGEKHMAEGDKALIVSFGKKSANTVDDQNKMCLACHKTSKDVMSWNASHHKAEGLRCTSCHKVHQENIKSVTTDTCLSCHKDVKMDLSKQSHHPVVEGRVSCNDCHNPHGELGRGNIRAESVNSLCYRCHADKRGPFVWEHPPAEENCLACHNAHGSSQRALTKAKAPFLCRECHTYNHGGNGIYTSGKGFETVGASSEGYKYVVGGCMNCHSKIHGSMAPHNPTGSGNSGRYFLR